MDFQTLHDTIPYARFGKEKSLEMKPYPDITLGLPGRHAEDTSPKGGDFVVMVTDPHVKWKRHQFKHSDLFHDIELKATDHTYAKLMQKDADAILLQFMEAYLAVIQGDDPSSHCFVEFDYLAGLRGGPFLRAVQCLAVAEHRRYHQHEAKFGGRFLPFRFVAGIAEGLWTASAGTDVQKYGRPAVERLEKTNGTPILTKKLMGK
jgi:hypothetical protein